MRLLLLAALAAAAPSPMALRDLPGTRGAWQEGSAIIAAPPAVVWSWLTDYRRWPSRFPDIAWSEVLPNDARGRYVIRFRSRMADRVFVLREEVRPALLVFEATAPSLRMQGRIYVLDAGGGRTRVVMQSTAEVHGFWRLFATRGAKRDSSFRVIRSYLQALDALARARLDAAAR